MDALGKNMKRNTLIAIGAVFGTFLILFAIWGMGVALAPVFGRGEAHKQLNSAEFRISAYNHFFETCSSIQGLEGSIDALEVQLAETTDERNKAIVQSSLAGTRAARQQAIADYNADARKEYTEGQFRDADLPFYIDPKGETTSCGYD
jgi:apolipoprotein N-acyltransferase